MGAEGRAPSFTCWRQKQPGRYRKRTGGMQTAEWISLQWLSLTFFFFFFLREQGTGWAVKGPVGGRSQEHQQASQEPLHDLGQEFHHFMLPQALSLQVHQENRTT